MRINLEKGLKRITFLISVLATIAAGIYTIPSFIEQTKKYSNKNTILKMDRFISTKDLELNTNPKPWEYYDLQQRKVSKVYVATDTEKNLKFAFIYDSTKHLSENDINQILASNEYINLDIMGTFESLPKAEKKEILFEKVWKVRNADSEKCLKRNKRELVNLAFINFALLTLTAIAPWVLFYLFRFIIQGFLVKTP